MLHCSKVRMQQPFPSLLTILQFYLLSLGCISPKSAEICWLTKVDLFLEIASSWGRITGSGMFIDFLAIEYLQLMTTCTKSMHIFAVWLPPFFQIIYHTTGECTRSSSILKFDPWSPSHVPTIHNINNHHIVLAMSRTRESVYSAHDCGAIDWLTPLPLLEEGHCPPILGQRMAKYEQNTGGIRASVCGTSIFPRRPTSLALPISDPHREKGHNSLNIQSKIIKGEDKLLKMPDHDLQLSRSQKT
ncbi:hypothetical protein PM082_023358 [Marasmius tenuissimus]|nr:hypothetical protein PM082_023358 [Marasmius tenuissimus]